MTFFYTVLPQVIQHSYTHWRRKTKTQSVTPDSKRCFKARVGSRESQPPHLCISLETQMSHYPSLSFSSTDLASVLGRSVLATERWMRLTQDVVTLHQGIVLLAPADFKYQFADIQKVLSAHFKLQGKNTLAFRRQRQQPTQHRQNLHTQRRERVWNLRNDPGKNLEKLGPCCVSYNI